MKDKELLDIYVDLAPFLAEVMGPGCEIIVHDASDPEHSIIAIENNLSHRELGGPMTNLAMDILNNAAYEERDYLTNYRGSTKTDTYRSSTYFIKNRGKIIGMLCVNKSLENVGEFENSLKLLLERYNLVAPEEDAISEDLDTSVESLMHNRIAEIIVESGIAPERMSLKEKVAAVKRLQEAGILVMKGAVAEIASQLNVSVPTVYRYLKKAD